MKKKFMLFALTVLVKLVYFPVTCLSQDGNASPLPVSLLAFDAELQKSESVKCTWITAAQVNNDHFEVERSRTGQGFERIGIIEGAGNSTSVIDYSFIDDEPFSGLSYYRLKQVDFDGRFTYSDPRTVIVGMKGIRYMAYPNPATTHVNLVFSPETEFEGTMRIVDVLGNVVLEETVSIGKQEHLVQVDLSMLAAGNYVLQILSDGRFEQQKISVVK